MPPLCLCFCWFFHSPNNKSLPAPKGLSLPRLQTQSQSRDIFHGGPGVFENVRGHLNHPQWEPGSEPAGPAAVFVPFKKPPLEALRSDGRKKVRMSCVAFLGCFLSFVGLAWVNSFVRLWLGGGRVAVQSQSFFLLDFGWKLLGCWCVLGCLLSCALLVCLLVFACDMRLTCSSFPFKPSKQPAV